MADTCMAVLVYSVIDQGDLSNTDISFDSNATCLRCDGIYNGHFTENFLLFVVKTWQS